MISPDICSPLVNPPQLIKYLWEKRQEWRKAKAISCVEADKEGLSRLPRDVREDTEVITAAARQHISSLQYVSPDVLKKIPELHDKYIQFQNLQINLNRVAQSGQTDISVDMLMNHCFMEMLSRTWDKNLSSGLPVNQLLLKREHLDLPRNVLVIDHTPYLLLTDSNDKSLGKGSFKQVYLSVNLVSRGLHAIAIAQTSVFNEIQFFKDLEKSGKEKCPQIVYIDHFYENQNLNRSYTVMEFCDAGPLSKVINNHRLRLEEKRDLMRDLIKGLSFVHCAGYVHRDLKSANIICTNQGRIKAKISDFGLACRFDDHRKRAEFSGTRDSLSPEACKIFVETSQGKLSKNDPLVIHTWKEATGEKGDCWALGTIFYELLYGQPLHFYTLYTAWYMGGCSMPFYCPWMEKERTEWEASNQTILEGLLLIKPSERFTLQMAELEFPKEYFF